jgi:hypothetical protein
MIVISNNSVNGDQNDYKIGAACCGLTSGTILPITQSSKQSWTVQSVLRKKERKDNCLISFKVSGVKCVHLYIELYLHICIYLKYIVLNFNMLGRHLTDVETCRSSRRRRRRRIACGCSNLKKIFSIIAVVSHMIGGDNGCISAAGIARITINTGQRFCCYFFLYLRYLSFFNRSYF